MGFTLLFLLYVATGYAQPDNRSLQNFTERSARLASPDSVRNLRLSNISDSTIALLRTLPKLRGLHLSISSDSLPYQDLIGTLSTLESLTIQCQGASTVPKELLALPSLKSLTVYSCGGRYRFSDGDFANLETLRLYSSAQIWVSLRSLPSLKHLILSGRFPKELSISSTKLPNLETLEVDSRFIQRVSDGIGSLSRLQKLKLTCSYLIAIPQSVGNLAELQDVEIHAMNSVLNSIPKSFEKLNNLKRLVVRSEALRNVPKNLGKIPSLVWVDLYGSADLRVPNSLTKNKSITLVVRRKVEPTTPVLPVLSVAGMFNGAGPGLSLGVVQATAHRVRIHWLTYLWQPSGWFFGAEVKPNTSPLLGLTASRMDVSSILYYDAGLQYYTDFKAAAIMAHAEIGLYLGFAQVGVGYNLPLLKVDPSLDGVDEFRFRVIAQLAPL